MAKKKKILVHSNHSKAFTGFGKNARNILTHLYNTDKYELVEFCNGFCWSTPDLQKMPWKTYGSLPDDQSLIDKLNKDPNLARAAGYGANMVDHVIKEEKPDLYLGVEDIWAFNGYTKRLWWNKTNCMIWTTLDSVPILPDAVEAAPNIKNYYVWASFAERELHKLGHAHVKTLPGSLNCANFYRLEDQLRSQLRQKSNIPQNTFIIGFVFRNQLRKSVPNLLDGFSLFLQQEPRSNAKLLLHTHWGEGWDIPRLLKEKNIDPSLILTTYFCNKCGAYEVRQFTGQEQTCRACGSEKSLNTTNVKQGVSEQQLNEIYNLMDVYCHPFTSGGQELPVQEAKLTELITLVTNYSCGEDSCTPKSGGLPLEWAEYREPGTQFVKASTYASSISKKLKKVYNMAGAKKREQEIKSRKYVVNNYSIETIGEKLEKIIDELPDIEWDFDFSFQKRNPEYTPPKVEDNAAWLIDIYKNILQMKVDENDEGHKHWTQRLSTDMQRPAVLEYFYSVARKENSENVKIDFADVFFKNDNKKALFVCSGDQAIIFAATSLLDSFHKNYPNTDLYFACRPEFESLLDGNPNIAKVLPYHEMMEDEFAMVGRSNHKGFVDYYINLNKSILKNITSQSSFAHEFC